MIVNHYIGYRFTVYQIIVYFITVYRFMVNPRL